MSQGTLRECRRPPTLSYVVITREKTRSAAKLDEYKKIAPASFQKHPATFLAIHGRQEVLEGPKNDDIVILEFPSYESAQAWYHSPEYQVALLLFLLRASETTAVYGARLAAFRAWV